MDITALEHMPAEELHSRHSRLRAELAAHTPKAGGILVSSPLSIYYLTGTLATGLFWLPLDGKPLLGVRRGLERARVESSLIEVGGQVEPYRSYTDLLALCGTLPKTVAVDMNGFSWSQSELLRSRLTCVERFVPGDTALSRTRMIKSEWERKKLRLAGARHAHCLLELTPERIRPGMTEREIGIIVLNTFFEHGHCGLMRLAASNEIYMGHICAGESGLYPTGFDGPLGNKGMHPAVPYMGDAGTVWKDLLTIDANFVLEGYNTDKTVTFWAGDMPDIARRAYDCCRHIELRTAEAMRPGAIPSTLWHEAQKMAAAAGFADTFMGVGPERVRFLGHGIGLQVDEFPVMADRFDEPILPGMVMAIEPKIALPGLGMVGVEDTYEITEQGAACLTGDNRLVTF